MTSIHIHDLIDELHIPINQISIDGKIISIGNVGTCLIKDNKIIEPSLNWEKIYTLNKKKLIDLVYGMYQFKDDELEIIPRPNRILELKFKGTEMSLPSVRYAYHSNGEWTLERASI